MELFEGDGRFIGDGGRTLQSLWDAAEWKMISNCPGRYTLRHRHGPNRSPSAEFSVLDTRAFLTRTLGQETMEENGLVAVYEDLRSAKCSDVVQVAVFADSGGVITYCKQQAPSETSERGMLYVHTLNTASGLTRKLTGLGLHHVLEARRAALDSDPEIQ